MVILLKNTQYHRLKGQLQLVSRTPFSVTVLLLCRLHLSFPLLSLGATSRKEKEKKNGRAKKEVIQTKKLTSAAGFEPTRAEHNGLAVHLLNHSDKQTKRKLIGKQHFCCLLIYVTKICKLLLYIVIYNFYFIYHGNIIGILRIHENTRPHHQKVRTNDAHSRQQQCHHIHSSQKNT